MKPVENLPFPTSQMPVMMLLLGPLIDSVLGKKELRSPDEPHNLRCCLKLLQLVAKYNGGRFVVLVHIPVSDPPPSRIIKNNCF